MRPKNKTLFFDSISHLVLKIMTSFNIHVTWYAFVMRSHDSHGSSELNALMHRTFCCMDNEMIYFHTQII